MDRVTLLRRVRWALNRSREYGLDVKGFNPSFLLSIESLIESGKGLTEAQVEGALNVINLVDKATFDNWEEKFWKEQSYYMHGSD